MKQWLLLIAVAMLAACNNSNSANKAGAPDQAAVTLYEDNLCNVDATFSVPNMDEMGMPIGTELNETKYTYEVFY